MRALVAAVVIVMFQTLGASAAFAGGLSGGWTDGDGVGSTVDTTEGGGRGNHGGGSSSAPVCVYYPVSDEQREAVERWSQEDPGTVPQVGEKTDGPGTWQMRVCTFSTGTTEGRVVWVPQPAVNPAELAAQALDYRLLPLPAIDLSPAADKTQIVGIPVWLSVDSATWTPVSATAAAGAITVTTTATPSRITWMGGDGGSVTCNGPGKKYDPSKPDSAQHSDCTYSYKRSSATAPGQTFTMNASAVWNISWTATGVPPGVAAAGTLDAITRTTTLPIRVGEVQALNDRR